nr:elongation of very long chain fatty acids protein AAEL008004 [Halyomorpha halys]
MTTIRTTIEDCWDFLFVQLADHRTNNWPLVGNPIYIFSLMGLYLSFVLVWGPMLMEKREPFNLSRALILYNAIQVNVSIWLFWEAVDGAWLFKYNFSCEPVDWSESKESMRIARGFYIFYLAKISELADTVFFVLRKKYKQITFLHLYHHTGMPMISWGAVKYFPGGHSAFIGLVNSFVHIVMYTYYLFTAMGPKFQKYLWWKKYLTTLQLAQFCLTFLHSMQLLFYDCGYPRWTVFIVMPNAVFFYYLFNDFYQKAYKREDRTKKE